MTKPSLTQEIEAYCAQTGLSPSTVCERATGNSRLIERHTRRLELIARDEQRIRAWIAANPPENREDAA